MAKPILTTTVSASVPESSPRPERVEVIDALGRRIGLREPSFYEKSVGIYTLVGPELSKNDA